MPLRFAIIGDPVVHSLSPLLHATAFRALGIDAEYGRIRIAQDEIKDVWARTLLPDYDGFNVTLPLKESVLPLLDTVDELAASVGAVNTVSRVDGRLHGTNTDILGIRGTLAPAMELIRHQPAVLIGAGGTSRSATAALAADIHPSKLTFLVRDPRRGRDVATLARSLLSCSVQILRLGTSEAFSSLSEARLIVQTTPVGMVPESGLDPVQDFQGFHRDQVVFDVIYRPLQTAMLRRAATAGSRVLGGLELFLLQGAAAFQLWTRRTLPLDVVRPVILEALSA